MTLACFDIYGCTRCMVEYFIWAKIRCLSCQDLEKYVATQHGAVLFILTKPGRLIILAL
jgi:hypothetical protein